MNSSVYCRTQPWGLDEYVIADGLKFCYERPARKIDIDHLMVRLPGRGRMPFSRLRRIFRDVRAPVVVRTSDYA
jgi:hypothetical protein